MDREFAGGSIGTPSGPSPGAITDPVIVGARITDATAIPPRKRRREVPRCRPSRVTISLAPPRAWDVPYPPGMGGWIGSIRRDHKNRFDARAGLFGEIHVLDL